MHLRRHCIKETHAPLSTSNSFRSAYPRRHARSGGFVRPEEATSPFFLQPVCPKILRRSAAGTASSHEPLNRRLHISRTILSQIFEDKGTPAKSRQSCCSAMKSSIMTPAAQSPRGNFPLKVTNCCKLRPSRRQSLRWLSCPISTAFRSPMAKVRRQGT